jgi:hypothetical protein
VAKVCACLLGILLLAALPLPAQATGVADVYAQIKAEETSNSNHVDYSRFGRRLRPALDGHAESEGRRRLGGQDHGFVGPCQHTSRAVDVSAAERSHARPGPGKYGIARRSRRALPRAVDGKTARVDAKHKKGVPRYLLVYAYSESAFAGFQPVTRTSTTITPVSGSGTVMNFYGDAWNFTYYGTVETTEMDTIEAPYVIQSHSLHLNAYEVSGAIV